MRPLGSRLVLAFGLSLSSLVLPARALGLDQTPLGVLPLGTLVRLTCADDFVSSHLPEAAASARREPYLRRTGLMARWRLRGWIVDRSPQALQLRLLGSGRDLAVPRRAIRDLAVSRAYRLGPDGRAPPLLDPMLSAGDRIRVTSRRPSGPASPGTGPRALPSPVTGSFGLLTPDSLVVGLRSGAVAVPLAAVARLQRPRSIRRAVLTFAGLGFGLGTFGSFALNATGTVGHTTDVLDLDRADWFLGHGLRGAAVGAVLGGMLAAVTWQDVRVSHPPGAGHVDLAPPLSRPAEPRPPAEPVVDGRASWSRVSALGADVALWPNGDVQFPPLIEYEIDDAGGLGLFRSTAWELEPGVYFTLATSVVFGGADVHRPGESCQFSQNFFAFHLDAGPTLGDPARWFLSLRAGPMVGHAGVSPSGGCGTSRDAVGLGAGVLAEVGMPVSRRFSLGICVRRGTSGWSYTTLRVQRSSSRPGK